MGMGLGRQSKPVRCKALGGIPSITPAQHGGRDGGKRVILGYTKRLRAVVCMRPCHKQTNIQNNCLRIGCLRVVRRRPEKENRI